MKRDYLIIPDASRARESMALAAEYGAAFEYNDFFLPEVYEDPAEVERRCELYMALPRDRSRDTLHGVFLDITLTSQDSVIRNHSRKMIEHSMTVAQRLGVRGVVFHTGLIAELGLTYYLNDWLEQSTDFWRSIAARFPRQTIYMENTFDRTPEMLKKLALRMRDVPNFKLCLDYGHAILTPTDMEEWLAQLAPYVGHIHLNDNDLKNDLHQIPGEGKIDFVRCKQHLEEHLADIPVLLELKGIENQRKALEFMTRL